jgi:hypothetical protein
VRGLTGIVTLMALMWALVEVEFAKATALSFTAPLFAAVGMPARHDVADPEPHEVVAAQLAVDAEVEKRAIPWVRAATEFEADRPDLLGLQRTLGSDLTGVVPERRCRPARSRGRMRLLTELCVVMVRVSADDRSCTRTEW